MSHDELHAAGSDRRFGQLPIEEMNSAQRAVNDWLVEYLHPEQMGTGATMGGPMAALLHNAKLAELTGQMATLIFDELSLPRSATELAILLTARHWNCNFSFDTHRRYAIKFGIKSAVVDAIEIGARPELDGELDQVYDFAAQLLRDGDVSDEAFERVAHRWGRQGAVELIATVGFSSMIALVLNVDRYPVPVGRILPTVGDGRVGARFIEGA